ncbi:M16 family metallopeptidase [Polluticaenibacter yanchengensis]|uniref:Pitrilysin family protein n=1 Tax=Polluticaenibacter yanchengensis TaxID=3014562 RepID=A0ABT4UJQ2_9BACT|nr:pitrilysin family protein [Chitinophagaceae bacterium LY-5]
MVDRKTAPSIKNAVDFNIQLQPYQKFTLKNGINVYVIDAGVEEVIQLEWIFMAGNRYETKNLVAAATNHLLKNGTQQYSAFDINEHFEFYGSFLNRACYNETASLSLHSMSKHLDHLLPMVAEVLTNATFPQSELDIFVQNSKQRLSVNLQKSDFVASREIEKIIYGADHPYGKYSSAEAYDALTVNDLKAYYEQYYKNGDCMIFMAGKVPANALDLLEKYFGSLTLTNPVIVVNDEYTEPAQKPYEEDIAVDKDGVQASIRLAQNFPNRLHPDFKEVQVLNTLLGGYFGSRLMSNIREEKGYTYGIHSYIQARKTQSAWMISTEAGRDVAAATIQEVYNEMAILRNELVDDEELMLVKNYILGSLLGDLEGPFQIINRWKSYILNGVGNDYFYESIKTIKEITPQRLQELAFKYLWPEKFYKLVVV